MFSVLIRAYQLLCCLAIFIETARVKLVAMKTISHNTPVISARIPFGTKRKFLYTCMPDWLTNRIIIVKIRTEGNKSRTPYSRVYSWGTKNQAGYNCLY